MTQEQIDNLLIDAVQQDCPNVLVRIIENNKVTPSRLNNIIVTEDNLDYSLADIANINENYQVLKVLLEYGCYLLQTEIILDTVYDQAEIDALVGHESEELKKTKKNSPSPKKPR